MTLTLQSTAGVLLVVALLAAILLAGRCVSRHRARWEAERPAWWSRKVDGPGLRLSVRPMGDPASAEVVSLRDPRVVTAKATRSPKRLRRVP